MFERLVDAFTVRFGRAPERCARAPGRVNWIGEHTDYNGGLVLPGAIDRDTLVAVAPSAEERVCVLALDLDREETFDPSSPKRAGSFVDYVQGVVAALAERGTRVPGLDLAVTSQVPRESGLSSSAALEVAVATALDALLELGLDATERARVAHRAETAFVGVPCGVMDQFASALGRADHVLRIDCAREEVRPIRAPSGVELLIFDSGVRRALVDGGYARRREECEAALEAARSEVSGSALASLSDLSADDLPALAKALEPVLFRRVRHVVTENGRVDATCRALEAGDLARAGAALSEGMRSLADDFEVSTPELDALCALADRHPGVFGSRLTGAGFGGCTVHLVEPAAAEEVADEVGRGFEGRFGRRPPVLQARLADGASVVTGPRVS